MAVINQTPHQKCNSLIKTRGIIEATYFVQTKISECKNEKEEIYWKNVLSFLHKAW